MDTVLNVYKRKSQTPLQAIERYVLKHPEFKKVKMTYAGRLDPMAEGVLVILAGEKNKERDAYTGLDKDYDFEFITGVETDTFDVLGKIVGVKDSSIVTADMLKTALKKYEGTFRQKYPEYSSKVVLGVPLFERSRKGTLGEIDLPDHEVTVSRAEIVGEYEVAKESMREQILKWISHVAGDFRQAEISTLWKNYFETSAPETFKVYKAKITCGSGFYVRKLVSDLGKDVGVGATTLSIMRTRVGEFKIEDSIRQ